MKKLAIFSIVMLVTFFDFAHAQNNPITVFADNFDSYTAGTFPSSGGWYLRYNGAGDSYQIVVNSQSHSGTQSMQMQGATSWTAQMEKSVDVQREAIYWQGWVKPMGNDGGLGLINSSIPTTGNYGVVYFDFGKIWCQIGYDVNVEIQNFTPNEWYKVKVRYDHICKCIDVWINDVQKITALHSNNIYADYYNTFYMFSEHDGNLFYFDDVEVWYQDNSDGLVAYYPFTGNAIDASGNGNNGVVYGATLTTDMSNSPDKAYYFDGNGDYIDCGNRSSLQVSGNITVCSWAKLQPTSHGQAVVNKYHLNADKGWLLEATPDGRVCFDGRPGPGGEMSNSGFSSQSIFDDTWHFLVGQRQNSTWKIYVDGMLASQAEGSNGDFTNSINLMIGVQSDRPSDGAAFSHAVIDDIRIYNRALTDSEIQQLYNESLTPVELSSFTAETGNGFITLKWTTQSETENYGFHVYRSQIKDGEYDRITNALILGNGSSGEAHNYFYVDCNLTSGNTYYYKLADVDFAGNVKFHGPISATVSALPTEYSLSQNYPNPFNPATIINFSLKETGKVTLKIYNLQGKLIRTLVDADRLAGNHSVSWDGTDHRGRKTAAGTYIYSLHANGFTESKKLIFLK